MKEALQEGWYRFSNGQIWRVSSDGTAEGVALVADYEDAEDLEQRLDAIAEAITGSIVGLQNFGYKDLGAGWMEFSGDVSYCFNEEEVDDVPVLVDPATPEFAQHMRVLYRLTAPEVDHAMQALSLASEAVDAEYVVPMAGTARALHYPRGRRVATYVRVVVGGCLEVHRLTSETVAENPMAEITTMLGHLTHLV